MTGMIRCRVAAMLAFAALAVAVPAVVPAAEGSEAQHEFDIEGGVGYDGNPFLTPDDPYFDQRAETTVDPETKSGLFVPFEVRGRSGIVRRNTRFVLPYKFRTAIYPDSELKNANEYFARIRPGVEWIVGRRGTRENTVGLAPVVTYNKEIYFDRDTGAENDVGGTNLSDRYTYFAAGLEFAYHGRTHERLEWDVELLAEKRDYNEIQGISSLDHDRFEADVDVEIDLSDKVALELGVLYRVQDYVDRPSRNLDGQLLSSNPLLQYTYLDLAATLRVRPNRRWWLYFDLLRRDRTDEYVGYNDYAQDAARVRAVYDRDSFRVRVAVRRWNRDYDRAFIFDLPENPQDQSPNPLKTYETLDVDVRVDVPLGPRWRIFGELDFRDQDTADPRYAYTREELSAGLAWEI